jgi:hypothetical protein
MKNPLEVVCRFKFWNVINTTMLEHRTVHFLTRQTTSNHVITKETSMLEVKSAME